MIFLVFKSLLCCACNMTAGEKQEIIMVGNTQWRDIAHTFAIGHQSQCFVS